MAEGLYAQAEEISDAWRSEQNRPVPAESYSWVAEVFEDHVIAEVDGEYFNISFTRADDEIQFADRADWVEVEKQQEWIEKSFSKNLSRGDALVFQGGAIKALGDGKVGGHLVLFGDEETLDLEEEFFNAETNYDLDRSTASSVYFNHGIDPVLQKRRLGLGEMAIDGDVGVWIEAQLELRDQYERAVYDLTEAGKMGWSSGTSPSLIERVPVNSGKATWIKSWPLGLDASLTVIPAEPRNTAIPLKSFVKSQKYDLRALLEGAGEAPTVDPTSWGTKKKAAAMILVAAAHMNTEVHNG